MATLDALKRALREKASAASLPGQPLSEEQYSAAFDTLLRGSGWNTYQDFIIPQLAGVLSPMFASRRQVSVLEIGPGPESVLGYLPGHMRRKINRYAAFEPNGLFSTSLSEWLSSTTEAESPLPRLEAPPDIRRLPFTLNTRPDASPSTVGGRERYDIVLFCHSMYGMRPKRRFIERALEFLVMHSEKRMVVVFHRDGALDFDGLACNRTASFPTGVVCVEYKDEVLDCFASFVAGFTTGDGDEGTKAGWREICRSLGRPDGTRPGRLAFSAPEVMVSFSGHAPYLKSDLEGLVPLAEGSRAVKNREANLRRPSAIVKPREIRHVQVCVEWALNRRTGLTVLGGGHGGQCIMPNVLAVDMSAFDSISILPAGADGEDTGPLVVVEAGCKTGDVVAETMAAGLAVPLGSRPSVGAGLWLQGGIGHLARLHGLSCDSIVGAVLVSADCARVLYVGQVPGQHRPAGAVRPEEDAELLWGIRGAGTNFGIVISVTFKAYPAPKYSITNQVFRMELGPDTWRSLSRFDKAAAGHLPRHSSEDAYLYWEGDHLHLGVTKYELSTNDTEAERTACAGGEGGGDSTPATVDGVAAFEAEMYMSTMHGGHGGGKTSAFKRCVFLRRIGTKDVASRLVAAVESRPSPLCYLHMLHGGGAVSDVAAGATAFGCRDWEYACVVTGVWPRDQDGTPAARAAVQWVYDVAAGLLPLSSGAYGADLGTDPRDAELAARAFGPNLARLARMKRRWDPRDVLAYACPLPKAPMGPRLIVLVTGLHGAGKDHCAGLWVSAFTGRADGNNNKGISARAVSISDATKREYAAATGADADRLLEDRAYKEEHRPALTAFFRAQLLVRPWLAEEHFLSVVHGAADADVLFITGMRDEAPVATLGHLVPDSRLIEVRVEAPRDTRLVRRGGRCEGADAETRDAAGMDGEADVSSSETLDYRPCLAFNNGTPGVQAAGAFAESHLLPLVHEDLRRLESMARRVRDFPRPRIDFRHVLDIAQQPGGLALCTSLLLSRFGDWSRVGSIACCEAGGFVFASALAVRVDVPLALIRRAGKLPPPVLSAPKHGSHISSMSGHEPTKTDVEMERGVIPGGAPVVVVDDVLATGETLCAVLELLGKAGVRPEDTTVMAVAEFPTHRGRALLRRRGFGRVRIQSLLTFGGA